MPHEEELDAGVLPLPDDAHDVLVAVLRRDDLLPLANRVERLHTVAQPRRLLELFRPRRRLHLRRQLLREAIVLSFKESLDLAHGAVVALLGLQAGARRVAAVDVVLQARARLLAVDLDPAGPEREELAHEPQRLRIAVAG